MVGDAQRNSGVFKSKIVSASKYEMGLGGQIPEVRRVRRNLAMVLAMRAFILGTTGAFWLVGILFLLVRFLTFPMPLATRLWLLGLSPCVGVLPLILYYWRYLPTTTQIVATLDDFNHAGGLLMCKQLDGSTAWQAAELKVPRVRWRKSALLLNLVLALAFALWINLLPERFFRRLAVPPSASAMLENISAQLEQLAHEELLPEPELQKLSEQVAQISDQGDVYDPARILNTLDHIADELARATATQIDHLLAEQEALQAALALAAGLAASLPLDKLGNESVAQQAAHLDDFLQHLELSPALAEKMAALAENLRPLDAAKLAQLSASLRSELMLNEAQLQQLEVVKWDGTLGDCTACTNLVACETALAALLNSESKAGESAALLLAACDMAGTGLPTRGPGAAPLTWQAPISTEGVDFNTEAVSGTAIGTFQARLVGLSVAEPEVAPEPAAVTSGVLATETTAGAVSRPTLILPRHRATVQRFFANQAKTSELPSTIQP